jgi:hypothetical protein
MSNGLENKSAGSPAWLRNGVFGLLLSGLMSLIVSGISTAKALGFGVITADSANFVPSWLSAWVASWMVAFPVVLVVAPFVRRTVDRLLPPQKTNEV